MSGITQTVSDAVNYVSEAVQGSGKEASAEANKEVAKSSDAPVGARFDSAKQYVSDKLDQKSHEAKQEGYEQKLKN